MSASALLIIAIVLFTLAGALFVAAVIMFFVMNIPAIIGDLSGRTLAKGIQDIRNESANANSRSARAANRKNNPGRQFSIGDEYSKEKGYTVSSLAHASRRLDRKTVRGEKNPPKTSPGGTSANLKPLPKSGRLTGNLGKTNPQLNADEARAFPNQTPKSDMNDVYTQETSVLNTADNQYIQATTVLDNANAPYSQATTVLGNTNNPYNQATTVPGNQDIENDELLNSYFNEYTQGTTVLSNNPNNTNTVAKSNTQYMAARSSKAASNLPHGFRVVRKVSVTHCNEVL